MLDLLTLSLFTIFLIHYYIFKYKEYQIWHKLKDYETSVSEYNHIYTASSNMLFEKNIETAHEIKKNKIIEIINYGSDECWLDVYDENKKRIYHFYCPKYLLFSANYNQTYSLVAGKKYSFFFINIKGQCPLTFRQVDYHKIRVKGNLSKPSNLIVYEVKNNFNKILQEISKKYNIKYIKKLEIKSKWPSDYYIAEGILPPYSRAFLIASPKPGVQNIELISQNESYYFPMENSKNYCVLLETQGDQLLIVERCYQLISSVSYTSIVFVTDIP